MKKKIEAEIIWLLYDTRFLVKSCENHIEWGIHNKNQNEATADDDIKLKWSVRID